MTIIEKKNVKVCNLPEGYFKERLIEFVEDARTADVWVVATLGYIGDWAAYIGWPNVDSFKKQNGLVNEDCEYYATHVREPEEVARYGDKLSLGESTKLFPYLKEEDYRP